MPSIRRRCCCLNSFTSTAHPVPKPRARKSTRAQPCLSTRTRPRGRFPLATPLFVPPESSLIPHNTPLFITCPIRLKFRGGPPLLHTPKTTTRPQAHRPSPSTASIDHVLPGTEPVAARYVRARACVPAGSSSGLPREAAGVAGACVGCWALLPRRSRRGASIPRARDPWGRLIGPGSIGMIVEAFDDGRSMQAGPFFSASRTHFDRISWPFFTPPTFTQQSPPPTPSPPCAPPA